MVGMQLMQGIRVTAAPNTYHLMANDIRHSKITHGVLESIIWEEGAWDWTDYHGKRITQREKINSQLKNKYIYISQSISNRYGETHIRNWHVNRDNTDEYYTWRAVNSIANAWIPCSIRWRSEDHEWVKRVKISTIDAMKKIKHMSEDWWPNTDPKEDHSMPLQ